MRNGRKIANHVYMNELFFWNFIWRDGALNSYKILYPINAKLSFCRIKNAHRSFHQNHEYAARSFYFAFFFSLFTKRQTHATTKTAVAAISTGHTGSGQTLALISFSPW